MSGNKNQKTKLAKKVCEKIWGGGSQGEKLVRKKLFAKSSEIFLGKVGGKEGQKKFKKSKIKVQKIQKKVKKSLHFFFKKKFKKS